MGRYLLPIIVIFLLNSQALADSGKVDHVYKRIISLYSAHTENLVSLGAEDQLIGISTTDDYPETIGDKPRFSYREDPEKFIAAGPDLVLVRPMIERSYPQLLDKLKRAGIEVISLQPTSIDGIFDYWRTLGGLTGRRDAAEEMITSFAEQRKELAARVNSIPSTDRQRVYFEAIHKKMKTFARESIAIYVLEQAGGINIAADAIQVRQTNIAAYSKERILSKASEIDVFLAQQGRMNAVNIQTIMNEPGFKAIKAVQEGKVFLIEESLVSRPTLRIIEGIRQINTLLYPDLAASDKP